MVTIVLALKLSPVMWKGKKIRIKCDNQAVDLGRTRDRFLAACARNLWYFASKF